MTQTPYYWQYLPLLMQILAAFAVGVGMVVASWYVGRHRNTETKAAAYECGIVAVGDARGRFSVRFYMVAMLFILFDVEAAFLLPWAVQYKAHLGTFWVMLSFVGTLLVGYIYAWGKGALEWER